MDVPDDGSRECNINDIAVERCREILWQLARTSDYDPHDQADCQKKYVRHLRLLLFRWTLRADVDCEPDTLDCSVGPEHAMTAAGREQEIVARPEMSWFNFPLDLEIGRAGDQHHPL